MAACDGQHVGRLGGSAGAERAHVSAEHAHAGTRAHAGTHAHVSAEHADAGIQHAHASTQHAHAGTQHAHTSATTQRAVQTIPPAIRRLVLRRDSGRRVVPGCRHATWVDVHHLEPRAEGGGHDPNNLVTLCGAHHRALHRGALVIEGAVTTGLTFRHADGSRYGALTSPSVADISAKAFQALRRLGFGEGEVRRALAQAARIGAGDSTETLVRRSLLLLTERHARAS
jgi:hypothetical protein